MTIGVLYYESPLMLKKQIEFWRNYPNGLKYIVIDDGSPTKPAKDVLRNTDLDIELYRIEENIPWNIGGARNLLFTVCEDDWVLMMDIDHLMSLSGIDYIHSMPLDENCHYRFARFRPKEDRWIKPHRDTILVRRDDYWKVGGFDEDISGYYGGKSMFFKQLEKISNPVNLDNVYVIFVGDQVDEGASWGKKGSKFDLHNNPALLRKVKNVYKPGKTLRFNWRREK